MSTEKVGKSNCVLVVQAVATAISGQNLGTPNPFSEEPVCLSVTLQRLSPSENL